MMRVRTRILRHPALREFYRNYRVLLTFRGFLLAAAATTLYLLIANTLGLEQLQELEQVQDEPLPGGVRRHPRLVGRVTRRRVEVVRPLLMISPPAPSMSNASTLRQRAVGIGGSPPTRCPGRRLPEHAEGRSARPRVPDPVPSTDAPACACVA